MEKKRSNYLYDGDLDMAKDAILDRDILTVLYRLNITNTDNPHAIKIKLRFWVRNELRKAIENGKR